ncbi:MAG: hypothetical protein AABZ47_00730 [Planctomycetota bacterium]
MNQPKPDTQERELTPVDDVRRVRERLSAEFNQDVSKLIDHAQKTAAPYHEKLGLKREENGSSR